MQTLDALRHAIETAQDLQSIVRTMKALAAVNIRQYERAVESLVDYNRTLDMGLKAVLRQSWLPDEQRLLKNKMAAVILGSDHGLCGRFNEAITTFALEEIRLERTKGTSCRLFTVGTRIAASLLSHGEKPDTAVALPASAQGITTGVRQVLLKIDQWRSQDIGKIILFYNKHRPGTADRQAMLQLLPLTSARPHVLSKEPWPSRSLPTFTMPRKSLFASLIHQFLFVSVFRAFAESLASEQTNRLISMQVAEKNIQEHLLELGSSYREQRQNAITEELLDVISGFEAIKTGQTEER